ncbi:MAG: DUF6531 domain-containing protein, partial [Pseudomonadota bacterium]
MAARSWVARWLGLVGLAFVALNSAYAESEPSIAPPSSFPWAPYWYGGAAGGNPATNCTTVISHSVADRTPGGVAGSVCGVVGQCTGRTAGYLVTQPWPAWGDGIQGYARCQKPDGTSPASQWWVWGIKHCPADFLVNGQGTACYNQSAPNYCKAKEWTLNGAYCERPGKAKSWVNRGCGDNCKGNPVNPGNGNKFQIEPLYHGAGPFPLNFTLVYNHLGETTPSNYWGKRWTSTFHRFITTSPYLEHAQVIRPDGKAITFTRVAGQWTADADITGKLEWTLDAYGFPASWRYTGEGDEVETYDALGRLTSIENRAGLKHTVGYGGGGGLISVTDPTGRQIKFTHHATGRVATMKDPQDGTYAFAYGANGELATVTFPDGKVRTFHYEDTSFPDTLTGITDENGDRYATYDYDADGHAVLTERAGGANRYAFAYNPDGSSTVTDPLGAVRTYGFATPFTKLKGTHVQGPACPTCVGEARSVTHDANGFVASRTDWNGNLTTYTHDARGLETSRTEAAGTAQART